MNNLRTIIVIFATFWAISGHVGADELPVKLESIAPIQDLAPDLASLAMLGIGGIGLVLARRAHK